MNYDQEIDTYWWTVQDLVEHMRHRDVSEVLRDVLSAYDKVSVKEKNKAVVERFKGLNEDSPF